MPYLSQVGDRCLPFRSGIGGMSDGLLCLPAEPQGTDEGAPRAQLAEYIIPMGHNFLIVPNY